MARIRSIKPDFCSSADVGALSREARLFFLQILTEADDEGCMLWIPRRLCGVLYPFDNDVGGEDLQKWASECETRGMVKRYVVANVTYLAIVNWCKHQKISHPTKSKYPSPDDGCGTAPETFQKGSETNPETFRPDMEGEWEGEREKKKAPASPPDLRADLFRKWKALPGGGGAPFLSRLFREYKPEQKVLDAVERTLSETRADPKAFVVGCLKQADGDEFDPNVGMTASERKRLTLSASIPDFMVGAM